MKYEHLCFPLIPKANKEEVEDVPMDVANLLDDFQDIVSDNVPDGLPLVSKISHQMDLILGDNLLKKAAHRMIIGESEEFNKQVQELI